jgi:hypothetical protein
MTKIIQPTIRTNPYSPDCGDILDEGKKYILRKVENKEDLGDFVFLSCFSNDPWEALKVLNISRVDLQFSFKYKCPWSENWYYHFIPVALVLKNGVEQYRTDNLKNSSFDYAFDSSWAKQFTNGVLPEADSIQMAFLGHGYTYGTLPCDGNGDLINVLIELDNGDMLFGHCWEWYNK